MMASLFYCKLSVKISYWKTTSIIQFYLVLFNKFVADIRVLCVFTKN